MADQSLYSQLQTVYGIESGLVDQMLVTTLFNSKCGLKACALKDEPETFKTNIDLQELSFVIRKLKNFPGKEYVKILSVIRKRVTDYNTTVSVYSKMASQGSVLNAFHYDCVISRDSLFHS